MLGLLKVGIEVRKMNKENESSMSNDDDTYVWQIDTLPIWFQIEISKLGIKQDFKICDLTKEQRVHLNATIALFVLVKKGKVQVEVKDGQIYYKMTENGLRTAREVVKNK